MHAWTALTKLRYPFAGVCSSKSYSCTNATMRWTYCRATVKWSIMPRNASKNRWPDSLSSHSKYAILLWHMSISASYMANECVDGGVDWVAAAGGGWVGWLPLAVDGSSMFIDISSVSNDKCVKLELFVMVVEATIPLSKQLSFNVNWVLWSIIAWNGVMISSSVYRRTGIKRLRLKGVDRWHARILLPNLTKTCNHLALKIRFFQWNFYSFSISIQPSNHFVMTHSIQ